MSDEMKKMLLEYLRWLIRDQMRNVKVASAVAASLAGAEAAALECKRRIQATTAMLSEHGIDYTDLWNKEYSDEK